MSTDHGLALLVGLERHSGAGLDAQVRRCHVCSTDDVEEWQKHELDILHPHDLREVVGLDGLEPQRELVPSALTRTQSVVVQSSRGRVHVMRTRFLVLGGLGRRPWRNDCGSLNDPAKARAFDLDFAPPKLFALGSPALTATASGCEALAALLAWRALASASSFISTRCNMRFLTGGFGSSKDGGADEALPAPVGSAWSARGTCPPRSAAFSKRWHRRAPLVMSAGRVCRAGGSSTTTVSATASGEAAPCCP